MNKTAIAYDNYAQWAGIRQGSPIGADGTSGSYVNALRKLAFGSQGMNTTLWAQNANDASKALLTATQNSGYLNLLPGTTQANPAFSSYMGNIKDLSILNPGANAADMANMVGQLTSTRGLYASMLYGYTPLLGPGGTVNRGALGSFTDSVMRRAFGTTSVNAANLAAALGQNGNLNKSIQAYVKTAGGSQDMTTALENYITGRNTAARSGISGTQFDSLMAQYEAGGSAGKAAQQKLNQIGIGNTILQSQKSLTAAKDTTTNDLLDQFGPALKNANDALIQFTNTLNAIVNLPGIKQLAGSGAGYASALSGTLGGLGGGLLGGLVGKGGLGRLGGGGGGASGLLSGGEGGLAGGALASVGGAAAETGGALAGGYYLSKIAKTDATGKSTKGEGFSSWLKNTFSWTGIKNTLNPANLLHRPGSRTTGNDGRAGGMTDGGRGPVSSSSGSSSVGSGQSVTGKTAAGAISIAMSELGKPYQWGGTGPNSFDCSGLVQYAYQHGSGISLPRTSEQQMTVGAPINGVKNALPGDLMFPDAGHVVMYLGGNQIIEAPHTGADIRVMPVSEYGQYIAIRRIAGAVGNYSSSSQTSNTQTQQTNNLGGNSGSPAFFGDYGSTEEVDAISSAVATVHGVLANLPMGSSASSANNSSSGSSGVSAAPGSLSANEALGKRMAAAKGWTGSEWDALYALWMQESSWNSNAVNPSSGAYGIPQALGHGHPYNLGDAQAQIAWGLNYIAQRYGDPVKAEQHEKQFNWYDTGAWNIPQDQVAMVHKGEMIIERPKADTIRNALMSDVVNVKDPASGTTADKASAQGMVLNFGQGSIQFNVNGSMTLQHAQQAANSFAQALAQNSRLKELGVGL